MSAFREMILHMMERREHGSKNGSDTKPPSPALHREPDQAEKNALYEGEVRAVHAPYDTAEDRKANMPFSSDPAIEDGHGGDDELADDGCDHCLPY